MKTEFKDLKIKQHTLDQLTKIGINEPTPVQSLAIPYMMQDLDVIAQAQTGTGKTFAFAIPILEKIDKSNKSIQALVVCPTRELTNQVYNEFKKIISNNEYKITSIYGGESYNKQFKALKQNPDIIIATPGRVIDHMKRGTVDFSNLKVVVLDEADEMLKMGFQEDLETILEQTPSTRQTALFSATMPTVIKNIAKKYQKNAEILKVENKHLTVDNISQEYYMINKRDRDKLLIRVLDYYTPESSIIFCNTKKDVDSLVSFLQSKDYAADAIHGDLNQHQREIVMKKFRKKRIKYLVATDVAARGIDVSHVDYVINYEIPFENELYVHRIGRTGRAGKKGVSISFVYPSTVGRMRQIESYIKTKIDEKKIPTPKEIVNNQKTLSFDKMISTINENDKRYDEFLTHLEENDISLEAALFGLVSKEMASKADYEEIQTYVKPKGRKKGSRNSRGRNDQRGRRNSNKFVTMQINLGKNNGVRPAEFVDFVSKKADVYPRNIGDIKIKNNKTIFEVNRNSTKRIKKIHNKVLKGEKIKLNNI